jgi:glycosyltransferase involved in cell wall biosynthesis
MMLQKLLQSLDGRYSCAVVSLTSEARIGTELRSRGVPVVALGGRAGVLTPGQFMKLVRFYRQFTPDVVHAWMYHANLISQILVRIGGARRRPALITSIRGAAHAPREQKLTLRLVRRVDAALSRGADAIVFNSQRSAQQHAALGYDRHRFKIIPNGFDSERYQPLPAHRARIRAELGVEEQVLVGLVARFEPVKGQRLFLEAARIVAERCPKCRFLLAGRGCDPNNASLMGWINELQLADKVHVLGERPDIVAVDNALDIVVCSSLSESFPNSIGEAMACGVPAVVTDVGDCPVLVGNTGVTVPPRDATALAEAIVRVAGMSCADRSSLGLQARSRVIEEFSLRRVTRLFCELYDACAQVR